MKPMLAEDWVEEKQRFPVWAQPKIDGVRALNLHGATTGRSMKAHDNAYTTRFWTAPTMVGLDGEMAAERETHPDLCRITFSALSTKKGEPFTLWWLFDYINPRVAEWCYRDRYAALKARVLDLESEDPVRFNRLRIVPSYEIHSLDELNALDAEFLEQGYEGTILRDPEGPYKNGRSTVREGWLLRIKRFVEEDALVLRVEEGQTNLNEPTINALGYTERSTLQANMIPNGQVGRLICRALKDIFEPQTGRLLFAKDSKFIVSCGHADVPTRKAWWENPMLIVGKIIKFKFFPKGIKDKPRFPNFVCIREESDR